MQWEAKKDFFFLQLSFELKVIQQFLSVSFRKKKKEQMKSFLATPSFALRHILRQVESNKTKKKFILKVFA